MIPVTDLHCDLLLYLASDEKRTPYLADSRCSLSQMKKGSVIKQTLAIFTETDSHSVDKGLKQLNVFKAIRPEFLNQKIEPLAAIENASCLALEDEDLANAFRRLDSYLSQAGPILYISLTWNTENRFGGGNKTAVGLKKDGEVLLEYLSGKNIAIDLSHTSDKLAEDILNWIDKKKLQLPLLASHSNFRAVCDNPRNLPDAFAQEIIRRKGLIGLNLVRYFIGEPFEAKFIQMVEHAAALQGLDCLCFGADFFSDLDILNLNTTSLLPFFVERYGNSSCYPELLSLLQKQFSIANLERIAHQNFQRFCCR